MDFASFRKFLESIGYQKVSSLTKFTSFNTNFSKDNNTIVVKWEMGGYIKSITSRDTNGSNIDFNSAQEFVETF